MDRMNLKLSNGIKLVDVISLISKQYDVIVEKRTIHLMQHAIYETYDLELFFTDKEKKVLSLLKQGLKYAEIAEMMEMTIDGVRFYTKKIYKKLGVNNARKAVAAAENLRSH